MRTQQANRQTINQKMELLTALSRCHEPQLVPVRLYGEKDSSFCH